MVDFERLMSVADQGFRYPRVKLRQIKKKVGRKTHSLGHTSQENTRNFRCEGRKLLPENYKDIVYSSVKGTRNFPNFKQKIQRIVYCS